MSFLVPDQPGAPWQTRLCMTHHTVHVIRILHTHTVIFKVIPFQTCTKIFHDGRAQRGKASAFLVHMWLDGIYSLDSV